MPPTTGRNFQGEVKKAINNALLFQHRERVTAANVNAGYTLLPAVENYKYRMHSMAMIAVGGTASGATAVTILGMQSAASAVLMTAAVASLVQSVKFNADAAANIIANGLSYADNDVNTAITVGKTGGSLATATHIDFIVSYALERV